MSDERKVQRLRDEEWEDILFSQIKVGDTFRLFESTGEPVIGNKNDTEFIATSATYINNSNTYEVKINE